MMRNDDRKNEDFIFNEEVPESELYDKSNQSDIVYVESSERKTRVRILIVLAIILIILAIISALFGFIYLNNDRKNATDNSDVNITRYDIFVSYSDSSYGGNIVSFKNYNSSEKAFSYDLKVSNENPVDIEYKVEIVDNNYAENKDSLNMISYSLINNNVEIASGVLENKEINTLADVTIDSNSTNNLVLKVWSNKIDNNIGFNFKINVTV